MMMVVVVAVGYMLPATQLCSVCVAVYIYDNVKGVYYEWGEAWPVPYVASTALCCAWQGVFCAVCW